MRKLWTVVHRWAGLATAAFLIVSGLTGAVISWDHEVDEWLNPGLFEVDSRGAYKDPLELARMIEAAEPRAQITFVPLQFEAGHAAVYGVQPRVDPASGQLHELGYTQVFVDPVSGRWLGQREWGKVALDRPHLMSFLYKLHYSLHIPEMWGIDRWGVWFMGVIALIWTLDCFVGFYLTLPARGAGRAGTPAQRRTWWQRWKAAWQLKRNAGAARRTLDLHRAASLWTWALLFILAFTAFTLNFNREVFRPALAAFSTLTPSPFEQKPRQPINRPVAPGMDYAEAIALAQSEAQRQGWREPIGSMFYARRFGVYGAGFFEPGNDHGSGGMGVKRLYFDATDGRYMGKRVPWEGTAADVFTQIQFPLHSGRILGIPGRILVSVMGLVVAMLSVTGVLIWYRKRVRAARAAHLAPPAATSITAHVAASNTATFAKNPSPGAAFRAK